MKIASIVGARPQFIKLAPLDRALRSHQRQRSRSKIDHIIIHTGQHYDDKMNKVFFRELGLPAPDYDLEVRSGPHGLQTGEIMKRAEKVLLLVKPDWTLVYGDTNTTLAGALAAAKMNHRLAHIEAGLRSFDRTMPEETNRILTDHCSHILFCPTQTAVRNLKKEGFNNIVNRGLLATRQGKRSSLFFETPHPWVINVGDLMVDALLLSLSVAQRKSKILEKLQLTPGDYDLATVHRAQNTDEPARLRTLIEVLLETSQVRQVVFPVHPRTKKYLKRLSLWPSGSGRLRLIDPLGYFDMLILERNAARIWTDSGGVQKEAYFLNVPCLTLRETTEWPETVDSGWNILVGSDRENLRERISAAMKHAADRSASPKRSLKIRDYGDGHAAERIVSFLLNHA